MSNRAWVTLATNDSYGLGALVLAHSLRRVGSAYPSVVVTTPSVTDVMRDRLRAVFAEVVLVDVLDSGDAAHLALLQRPELGITFTKIHCWNLTQYEKCVFLDADALVVQNCDELFEREELSAAPDVGWPDCFNSGVFVYTPSAETFNRLVQFAQDRGSFDGGDQGLLNSFFSDWAHGDINKHLPFLYNVTSAAFYSYMPALKHYGQNLKIIHFIGPAKPWLQQFNWESRTVDAPEHLRQFLQLWWDLFVVDVHAQLDTSMVEVETPQQGPTEERPPDLPPQDVSRRFHYQAFLDPDSEFPWHRPDSRVPSVTRVPQIDMTEIFDPWDIYGGQIPPKPDDSTSPLSNRKTEEQTILRKYAWDYNGIDFNTSNKSLYQKHNHYDRLEERAHKQMDSYQNYSAPVCIHLHHQTKYNHNHTHHDIQYEQHKHGPRSHENLSQRTNNYNEQLYQQNHYIQDYLHNKEIQLDYSKHENTNKYQTYNEQSDQMDDISNNIHSTLKHTHEHENDTLCSNQLYTLAENTFNNNFPNLQTVNLCTIQDEPNFSNTGVYPKLTEQVYKTNGYHYLNHVESHKYKKPTLISLKQQEEEAQQLFLEPLTKNNRNHLQGKTPNVPNGITNGNASNSDDEFEDIIPRHPYDGYYLRHTVTVDSRGRKICTHEVPCMPSPSSLDTSGTQDYFSAEEDQISDNEDQSGVAGNLARVSLGSSQREAIDELTRRQGWEAGNIDYMGVDSFDNIWAKISQTLSQARTSPPKQSPPRESAPLQIAPEEVEVQTGKVTQEPKTDLVEVAQEVVPNNGTNLVHDVDVTNSAVTTEDASAKASVPPVDAASLAETPFIEAEITAELSTLALTSAITEVAIQTQADSGALVEPLPLITTESVTKPVIVTESPAAPEVCIPAEKVVEQCPVSEVLAPVEPPKTIADSIANEVTPITPEVIAVTSPVDVSASDIPVSVEAITSHETTCAGAAPDMKLTLEQQTGLVPEEIKQKTDTSVTKIDPVEPVGVPVIVPSVDTAPSAEPIVKEVKEISGVPISEKATNEPVVEKSKVVKPVPATPIPTAELPVCPVERTPEKSLTFDSASDSPPLANTPSKEETPDLSAAKTAERRKPAGKLQLSPPVAPDPLPTPDSELEDAAALAQSIIASELRTPTVTSPGSVSSPSSPPALLQHSRLSVDEPEVPTPPVGAVSLSQIGVKTKGKTSTAAQIESSVSAKPESLTQTPTGTTTQKTEAASVEAPKKKVVKKVVKKVAATGGDTPVPPPRKKEKKPKE